MKVNYEEVIKTIWEIKITDPNGYACWGPFVTYFAGVSVDKNRILSCHDQKQNPFDIENCTVFARREHETGFTHELETVHVRTNLGLMLWKCKIEPLGEFECGQISDDQVLNYGDEVIHIGHPERWFGSYLTGYVSYPCIEVNPMTFSDSRVCKDYRVCEDDAFENLLPPYRRMGDFVNVDSFLEDGVEDVEFNRKLHPMVPVIQCAGFPAVAGGFGGPLYRENGDIVGIVTHNYKNLGMAVHVSAVKAFLDEAKRNDEKVGAKEIKESTTLSRSLALDFDKLKKITWVIRVIDHSCIGGSVSYLGGVSIDKNCILTCAHGITETCTVSGRRLHENGVSHELETTYVRESWDLRLLKCKNETLGEFECGKVSDNEKFDCCEKVFHFGYFRQLIGSYFEGELTVPCTRVNPSTFSDSRVCKDHVPKIVGRRYLTMGDYVNVDAFLNGDIKDTEFNRKLHPMVPVIHCAGFRGKTVSFGGPLFGKNGDIVGIITQNYEGSAITVHVSAVKAFVAEAKSKDERFVFTTIEAKRNDEKVGAERFGASTSRRSQKKISNTFDVMFLQNGYSIVFL